MYPIRVSPSTLDIVLDFMNKIWILFLSYKSQKKEKMEEIENGT